MITWLRQLFRVAPVDDGSDADRLFGVLRSSEWPEVRDAWLKDHPQCAACRAREDLEVHHKVPVHVDPATELRQSNLVTLCRRCHLFVGHLGLWSSWNPDVETDAAIWRLKILRRPKLEDHQHGN